MITIVVVDDDERIHKVVNLMLKIWTKKREIQADIIALNDGSEAIDWVQDHGRPDMLLLDVRMPVMTGIAFLKKMDTLGVDFTGRMLFLTGYADDLDEHMGIKNMNMHFVRKPFTADELYSELDNIYFGLDEIPVQ